MSKFKKVFKKTDEKIGKNSTIDFQKSSVNKKNDVSDGLKNKTKRIQTYITERDFQRLVNILEPLETPAERVRKLIICELEKNEG